MKKKCILILMIIFLFISCISVKANEGDTYKISLDSSNSILKQGDTITITLKVSDINIQSGEKGIGAYEGKLVYDDEIFELVKMQGNDNWETPIENENNFISVRSDGICTDKDQDLATIVLKVKEKAKGTNTTIEVSDFEISNAETNIPTDNIKLTVKIEGNVNTVLIVAIIAMLIVAVIVGAYLITKKRK